MIAYKSFSGLRVGDKVLVTEFGIHHCFHKPRLKTLRGISEETTDKGARVIKLTFTSGQSYFVLGGTTKWTPTNTEIRIWANPEEENMVFWTYLMGIPAERREISLLETIQEHIRLDENLRETNGGR